MQERARFVILAGSGTYTLTDLCEQFGISRKTGYKWLERHANGGLKGLEEQSRRPRSNPGKTVEAVERLIVKERSLHPTWGGKKIQRVLETKYGLEAPPCVRTVDAVLKRHKLSRTRRRRPGVYAVERGNLTVPERPQHVLAVDFKGWFLTQDGERFEPLTVTDLHSRYLLRACALKQSTVKWTQQAFAGMFRLEGLPDIIRVDNGSPFASMGPGGLSRLSVWWITLGIEVEFTRPGCPQDNGSHERMHRTMKEECCQPSSANTRAQQLRMDRWRYHYNHERPHEALDMRVPAEVYQKSRRRLDEHIKRELYSPGTFTLPVSTSGAVSLEGSTYHVGEAFAGRKVALDEVDGDRVIRFANIKLGILPDKPGGRLRPYPYAKRWERDT